MPRMVFVNRIDRTGSLFSFVGLSPDDPIWHPTTCTKNRERLLNEQVMGR